MATPWSAGRTRFLPPVEMPAIRQRQQGVPADGAAEQGGIRFLIRPELHHRQRDGCEQATLKGTLQQDRGVCT